MTRMMSQERSRKEQCRTTLTKPCRSSKTWMKLCKLSLLPLYHSDRRLIMKTTERRGTLKRSPTKHTPSKGRLLLSPYLKWNLRLGRSTDFAKRLKLGKKRKNSLRRTRAKSSMWLKRSKSCCCELRRRMRRGKAGWRTGTKRKQGRGKPFEGVRLFFSDGSSFFWIIAWRRDSWGF